MKPRVIDLTAVADGTTITIGRSKQCDVPIDEPQISRQHARITLRDGRATIRDLDSMSGTFINDVAIAGVVTLQAEDLLRVGKSVFVVRLSEELCQQTGGEIGVADATIAIGEKRILDRVALTIRAGEFVGIVGPSGCGKSTLMGAIAGIRPLNSGNIAINGQIMSPAVLKKEVGYLPQSVILHETLTTRESLEYAAAIHGGEVAELEAVLTDTGMTNKADQLVKTLSGGQQKRAGLAQEMIFQPRLLCLDEVTSGLDPSSEKEMMNLFRDLSRAGKTVLCITHYPDRLVLCDKLICLYAGKLTFFGSPADCLTYFGIKSLDDLYDKLYTEKPEFWQKQWSENKTSTTNKTKRNAENAENENNTFADFFRQLIPLTLRYARLWQRQRGDILFLIIQGLLIGALIAIGFGNLDSLKNNLAKTTESRSLVFVLMLSALWIGATASVREIVKENNIMLHESRRNLNALAYTLSKFPPLALLSIPGCLSVYCVAMVATNLQCDGWQLLLGMLLVCWVSVGLGLAISAWSATQESALALLPVTVIGLALFSGGIMELRNAAETLARWFAYSFWGFEAFVNTLTSAHGKIINPQTRQALINPHADFGEAISKLLIYLLVLIIIAAIGVYHKQKKV